MNKHAYNGGDNIQIFLFVFLNFDPQILDISARAT